ncbi:MAG: hypothetical protein LBS56_05565 [Propionibacteriaceae bacterium]|jgi:hypothetical protein|nr:hypothetical protein [Propionibacteriaceae bacterium]
MGRSKKKSRWKRVRASEPGPGPDAVTPRRARRTVAAVVFGGRPRETWREAVAVALLGACYFLGFGGALVVHGLLGAPLDRVDGDSAGRAMMHLWLFFIPLGLAGRWLCRVNEFEGRTGVWWRPAGVAVMRAVGVELVMDAWIWGSGDLFLAGIGVLIVATTAFVVLRKARAFPVTQDRPATPVAMSLERGLRKKVWGPPPRTRTDWAALAVSWLAAPGVVVALRLLAAGRWFWAALVAAYSLTLPWWWAGRLRRARARRLGLTARALTWRGLVATALVTASCWWGGQYWASGTGRARSTEMEVAVCVALATWFAGVWLALGRRRPGPGLAGAWLVVLASGHAGNVFLGLSHGTSPMGGDVVPGWCAYGFMSVVSAALVWQLRRWRPIPGVPDPPVRGGSPEESDAQTTSEPPAGGIGPGAGGGRHTRRGRAPDQEPEPERRGQAEPGESTLDRARRQQPVPDEPARGRHQDWERRLTVRHSPDYVFELPRGWEVWDPAAPGAAARVADAVTANRVAAARVAAAARRVGEAAAEAADGAPETPFACLWMPDPEAGAVRASGHGLERCHSSAPGGRPTAEQWAEEARRAGQSDRYALFAQVSAFERRTGSGEAIKGVLESVVRLDSEDARPVQRVALRVFPPGSCCVVGIQLEAAVEDGPEGDPPASVRESLVEAATAYWESWEPAG